MCLDNHTLRKPKKTLLCGIVNVTPNSFSDGGKWSTTKKAVCHGLALINQGADLLDIGGEATHPGASYIAVQQEINRVIPVVRALKKKTQIPISVDTWKAPVAKKALEAGADIINDVTGLLGDPQMASVINSFSASAVLMFNSAIARPRFLRSQRFPTFGKARQSFSPQEFSWLKDQDIITMMKFYFRKSLKKAFQAGIKKKHLFLDPGIGFGETKKENLTLIKHLTLIHQWGYPIFLGVSRKRFLVKILKKVGFSFDPQNASGFRNRDLASSYFTALAGFQGIEVIRVHTISQHKLALAVANEIRSA